MDCENTGINHAYLLSLDIVDKTSMPPKRKAELIYSLYSLRCMFSPEGAANDIVKKYVSDGNEPERAGVYALVREVLSLAPSNKELYAAWYIIMPYLILSGTPVEDASFDAVLRLLLNEDVYNAVLNERHSLLIADSVYELQALDIPEVVINYYRPYIDYKNASVNGVSREAGRYARWLGEGRFSEVLYGTERYLDSFPDDEDVLLTNIAARISLEGTQTEKERTRILNETVALIESALERPGNKKEFLYYYYGVALIGLKAFDEAETKFNACLELKPDFDPAQKMLRVLKK